MDFNIFKNAIAQQFARMSKHALFRTGVDKDLMWQTYLDAFPEGTNPIYKTRREHDCNCCKSFIRVMGDVVAITDGEVVSLWDVDVGDITFNMVAREMSRLATSRPIQDAFLHYEPVVGTDKTLVQALEGVHTWRHFFVNLPATVVAFKDAIPTKLGDFRTRHDLFARALATISDDAIDTVLDLINKNALYRGAEHKEMVVSFKATKAVHDALSPDRRAAAVWLPVVKYPGPGTGDIRNTAIGTLLVDLSEGTPVERAVASFESKVAPANYKRPTAIVTKAMIESARAKIEELGLGSALQRRYATIDDITINNILFANRNARRVLGGGVFDDLAANAPAKDMEGKDTPIAVFLCEVMPTARDIEVLVENRHTPNLVSLIAPADPTAKSLFKWGNQFSWSYNGEFADSIKERVKAAGGNVTGDLCCRLAWSNYDDLDLHLETPLAHIFFGSKTDGRGGRLDVDMNAGRGHTRTPVENIFYADYNTMPQGEYHLYVNQFNLRERTDVGFEVEIDWLGTVHRFAYPRVVLDKQNVTVARFTYSRAKGVEIIESLPPSTATREVWGITTQTFQPVSVLTRSPNYWDGRGVGNEHVFFMLENCRNEGQARGFYNEFLLNDLTPHRKVIEMVGAKLRTDESDRQLSGLGFSTTQRNSITCRVKDSTKTRLYNVTF